MIRSCALAIGLLLGLAACSTPSPTAGYVSPAGQPANVGDAKIAALNYRASGQYDRDLDAVAAQAQAWLKSRAQSVAVFFITGRPESQQAATERNLGTAGYAGYARLFMVPDGAHFASAADFKAPIRAGIERQGYTIIANVGDQPSDLEGGHAERAFLLPNPFYRVP